MMVRRRPPHSYLALIAILLPLLTAQVALADMAPLPSAAASNLVPGRGTQVAMIAETVVLEIQAQMPTDFRAGALVTADFRLRNLGPEAESMDVRFPLGYPALRAGPIPATFQAQGLRVWIGDAEATTQTATFGGAPWAVWPMQFPPGQDVHARVTYRITGIDNSTYSTFFYILETGAGWRGPIGQGEIIVRLPYPADPEMWLQPPEADGALPANGYYPASTPPFHVEGNELRWRFTNLEPAGHDNLRISVLNPPLWQAILDARQAVERRPDDPAAQLRLGQAYHAAIPMKHGWLDRYPFQDHFGALAEAALVKTVAMALDDPAAHAAYATFLAERSWSSDPEPYYYEARRELERAQQLGAPASALAPAREIVDLVGQFILSTPTPGVPPAQTVTPTPAVRQDEITPAEQRTASVHAAPSAAPTAPGAQSAGATQRSVEPVRDVPTGQAISDSHVSVPGSPGWPLPAAGGAALITLAGLLVVRVRQSRRR